MKGNWVGVVTTDELPRQRLAPPLKPQPHTFPFVSMASAVSKGMGLGIWAILTPDGKSTCTGVRKVGCAATVPIPSSPYWLAPKAQTVPDAVRT